MERPPLIQPKTYRELILRKGQEKAYLRADLYRTASDSSYERERELAQRLEIDAMEWWHLGAADREFKADKDSPMDATSEQQPLILNNMPPQKEYTLEEVTRLFGTRYKLVLRIFSSSDYDWEEPAAHGNVYWHAKIWDLVESRQLGCEQRAIDPDWAVAFAMEKNKMEMQQGLAIWEELEGVEPNKCKEAGGKSFRKSER